MKAAKEPATRGAPARAIKDARAKSFIRVDDLPGARVAARNAVSYAAKRGDLVRVRRGLYYKGARTRYGVTRPDPEAAAREALGREGLGPTGYTAARLFGLTTQVPTAVELAIAGPTATGLPHVRLHKRNNMKRRRLRYEEVALLELLRDPELLVDGGWSALVTAARAAADTRTVRLPELARVAEGEASPVVRERARRLVAEAA